LATVYGIVKQSGGYVWVQSAPNRGSTFRVYLPRVEERAEPEPAVRAKDSRRTARGEETILLVEDEEGVRELMRESLTRAEYTVLSARDGIEGLALYEKHAGKISLVVSDAVLPGMTGRELAQKLVQATAGGKRPKLLFVTGYADEAMRQDGLLAGASLLRKPFRMVEFLECVRSALDGRPAR
jgi:CheY-like chemotaxis protein